jgi:hypothetical protein
VTVRIRIAYNNCTAVLIHCLNSFNISTNTNLQNSSGVPQPPVLILGVPIYGHPSDQDHRAAGSVAAGRSLHCLEMTVYKTELYCLNLQWKEKLKPIYCLTL